MQFEVCANSVDSCVGAQRGGAQRVELCAGISEGGTTPSYGEVLTARELLNIKLHIIIRPRGGDFLYSETEIKIMERDIHTAHQAGVDGVVFGCLTQEGNVDIALTNRLMQASKGLSVTFHRAFDQCRKPFQVLEQLIDLGCDRILTSGQQPTAEKGIPIIRELIDKARDRIIILPGGGINETNIKLIAINTGAKEFHFSARESIKSEMRHYNPHIYMGATPYDEYTRLVTTEQRVRKMIQQLY